MAIAILCPTCRRKIKVPENLARRQVKCPLCKAPFIVPDVVPVAQPVTPPPQAPRVEREPGDPLDFSLPPPGPKKIDKIKPRPPAEEPAFDFAFTPPADEVGEPAPLVFKTAPEKTVAPPAPDFPTAPEKTPKAPALIFPTATETAAGPPAFSLEGASEIAAEPPGPEFPTTEKPPEESAPPTAAKETEKDVKTDAVPRPAKPGRTAKPSALADFLSFRRMITPIIVQIIFWIGTVMSLLAGGSLIVLAVMGNGGLISGIYGLLMLFVGPLVTRIQCELLIVFFQIHKTLIEIRDKTEASNHLGKEIS
jgi:hypothetical protein